MKITKEMLTAELEVTQEFYKGWECFELIPEGWRVDRTAGSPLHGYEFITNGKSVLNGGKRALVRVFKESLRIVTPPLKNTRIVENEKQDKKVQVIDENYRRTVNDLARKRFEQKLLADIRVDLMVCELEGWNKLEYIEELKTLMNGFIKE